MFLKAAYALTALSLATSCAINSTSTHSKSSKCDFDRRSMLALDETAFDQDTSGKGGGWRAISADKDCELVAADLISDYRVHNNSSSTMLFWHEGQLRAFSGQTERAIELFKRSYRPENSTGWDHYVSATIAFLERDRESLDAAATKLRGIPPPNGMSLKDGRLEVMRPDRSMTTIEWPPNADVVRGLQNCFNFPYSEAYSSSSCRQRARI